MAKHQAPASQDRQPGKKSMRSARTPRSPPPPGRAARPWDGPLRPSAPGKQRGSQVHIQIAVGDLR